MRICILGSFSGRGDEGMANVSYNLYQNLRSKYPDVVLLDLNRIHSRDFWSMILSNRPEILHYIPGPTIKGLALAKILQLLVRCKLVISATKPVIPPYFKRISSLFRPDIIIVQSNKSENLFKNAKYKTVFLPNGVDIMKFVPVSRLRKQELRKKYGFDETDFIILHIGPLKEGRNQQSLLQIKDAKLLFITSTTNPSDNKTLQDLKNSHAIVWSTYFPNIQEIYALSDLYVFPVFQELNSIDIPLSVLEAMSCDLPVITTRYGGLDRFLAEGDGLFFVDNENDMKAKIATVRKENFQAGTRNKVLAFSWTSIAENVSKLYISIME